MKSYNIIKFLFLIIFSPLSWVNAQTLPLQMIDGAGTLRLGVINEGSNCWIDQCTIKQKANCYTIKNKAWDKGELKVTICNLNNTTGFIVEIKSIKMPHDTKLCWAFGGCNDNILPTTKVNSIPLKSCADNVFCTEGNAFTTYFGEVMKLRTVNGVMPDGEEIKLADAHKQETPDMLLKSGKRTDAPVIVSTIDGKEDDTHYFCVYRQNREADYNYYMLKTLFGQVNNKKQ